MTTRNPYPPPGPPSADDGAQPTHIPERPEGAVTPEAQLLAAAAIGQDVTTRLAALDRLYENRHITATELGEARRQILASADASDAAQLPAASDPVATTSAHPPAANGGSGGTPPPSQVVSGHVGPPEPPPEKKIAGLPVWAAAAIAGVAIVAVIALAFLLFGGGGDSNATAPAEVADYSAQIKGPLALLTGSAVTTGKALARVSQPGEIKAFNRVAERQIDVVETARARLSQIDVAPADRRAQGRLVAAAANQRRYLVQLGRASAGTPDKDSLAALNKARQAGGQTLTSYKTFFALVPAAPDAITATDLTDTSGLRGAITESIAAATAPTPRSTPAPAPAPPRTYSTSSFQSPTGNLHCQVSGGSLFCSSSNDGFGVILPSYGSPNTGSGVASGGETVPYGSNWVNGIFSCDSESNGVTCRNGSGNGFFLNRDSYNPF